jgi:hypothetical protein
MLTFKMHIRTAWDDYFTGNKTNYNSETYGSKPTLSGTSVYVSNCLFISITSGGNGGALSCTSVTYLLIESTSFFSCKTSSQNGGAIYFSYSSGQCVLHEVCGYDCYSTYTGSSSYSQFAHIVVNNAITSKNYVNYSSFVRCVNERSKSHYPLGLANGKICCPSVNISMNKCYWHSGIYCRPFKDSNSFTCSLSHSSLTDNIATDCVCISFLTGNANCEMKSCNIIRNTQCTLSLHGTFNVCDNLMIEDSCILENKANRIFYQHHSSCTITLSNCTVDSTSYNQNLVTKNTVTKSFIHALKHMSTQNCHSEYDSAGTLTPIIQSPSPSKKQKLYFSCEKFLYQSQLRIFFSLLNVFIFNFIHLNTSDNLFC